MTELTDALARLGFTQYEAQAYSALVGHEPSTGAEVSRRAGMPASKVYETLHRLEARGAVLANRSDTVRYVAVDPGRVIAAIRAQVDRDLRSAQDAATRLPLHREAGLVWSLTGSEANTRAFARAIEDATTTLFAGVWDEELDELGPLMEAAAARGVDTHVAIYGARTLSGPRTYDLSECGASARLRLAGRRLAVVVADDTDAVVAEYGDRTPDQGTSTTNPVLALLAVEYIKADVTGRLLIDSLAPGVYERLRASGDLSVILAPLVEEDDPSGARPHG